MRIQFTIDVGVKVDSYKEAGKILDKITRDLKEVLGDDGQFDLRTFEARHRAVHEYGDQAMMVERAEIPERD